jgi:L,D-peptidoglycan transpeptidase YkuD (ErfK/YbiS/YcfS/YnhG family)
MAVLLAVAAVAIFSPGALSQVQPENCPAALVEARRLVLVTARSMNDMKAVMRLYTRSSPSEGWVPAGPGEPALLGTAGMGWSHFFLRHARTGEPIKVEHDKRAPAGIYPMGRSFGTVPSSRPGHLHVTADTVCVDEPSSPQYNTITSRKLVPNSVRVENMSQVLPMYRRGLLVDYPTNAKARAGSCIFIHVWRSPATGTAGCVAMPESRIEALQDFAAGGAAIAILPQHALGRFGRCLPTPR